MTGRQKFWLKVVLAVTFPAWILPAAVCVMAWLACLLIWEAVSDIVEPGQMQVSEDWDGP